MFPFDPLETERLELRRVRLEDADVITRLLQERQIALDAAGIPYPFAHSDAVDWIEESTQAYFSRIGATYAVLRRDDTRFVGFIGLTLWREHQRGEIGYWFGKPYWGQGYATEAVRRIVQMAFDDLKLNRVEANCYTYNLASARVMQKVGMSFEGTMRQYLYNRVAGRFEDLHFYGLLREDYLAHMEL